MTVTAEDGETATSDETAPVTNDMSAEIKLVDLDGLQTDGTALSGDTLEVSYGADLGTPNIVIWYCNGAAKQVNSLDGAGIGPTSFANVPAALAVNPAGDWWVTIENTAGQVSVSNVITVAVTDVAVMSDFSIEDDYDTPRIAFTTTDGSAIMNVTLNKQYFGTLYVNEVDNETYTVAKMKGTISLANTAGTWPATMTDVENAANFSNKAVPVTAGNGIYYAETDGTIHAKIRSPFAVTRGTEYELIFEQSNVNGDELGAKVKKEDLNVSDSYTAPYVVAPEEIVVTSYSNGTTTPKVTMYGEDGEVLDWWTATASGGDTTTGFDSMKFYSIDSNTASASDMASVTADVKVDDGVATLTLGTATTNEYGYAKFKTTKGVFGATSATLTSEVFEGAMDPMEEMKLAQDSSDPKAAKVTFKNLKGVASGNLYVFQASDTATSGVSDPIATVAGYDKKKALASAEIAGGTTSVVLDDVFEAVELTDTYKNNFVAVFEPDDTDLFKTVYDGDGNGAFFTLKQKLTSYKLFGDATATTGLASTYKFTGAAVYDSEGDTTGTKAYLAAFDQFGDAIVGDCADPDVTVKSTTFSVVASTFDGDAPADVATAQNLKVTTATATAGDAANEITLTQSAVAFGKALKKGNALEATLTTGQKLKFTVDTIDAAGGLVKFKLSIS